MIRQTFSIIALSLITPLAAAQPGPGYARDIRPFLTKYCSECHNAKTMKGSLNLDTYKTMMDGSDGGAVIVAGKPDDSRLVILIEHKDKPVMPPAKAKFQPTKAEIALVRAWVKAGAKDDGASVKIELPTIKAATALPAPITKVIYHEKSKKLLFGSPADGRSWMVELGGFSPELIELSSRGGVDVELEKRLLELVVGKKALATAHYDGGIRLSSDDKKFDLKEHSDSVYGLAFNPDGNLLASVSADRSMKVWDVDKGKLLYTLGHATDWLYAVAWSPDGKFLVSGGVDKSIRVYEPTATGAKLRQSVFAHEGPVLKLVFSSDSKTLYSVGEDRVVKAWDIEKMVERKVYDKQPETVLCLALREDAGQIIVGRYDGIVQLIDMKTGKVVHEFGREEAEKGRGEREKKPAPSPQANNVSPRGADAPDMTSIPGNLDRAGAVFIHRFDAEKGQQLGMQVVAAGKAKFEPVLTLTDAAGKIVGESFDGLLGHTFADAGTYAISVRDRDYRGGPGFKFTLKLGEIPIVAAVFPMGVQKDTVGRVHLDGVFLPKPVVNFNARGKVGDMLPLDAGPGVLGKAQVLIGEFTEVHAGQPIPVPGTANGRLLKENQSDLWRFTAKKGERLIVEVNARRIGSRLDSEIEILDKAGQPVPRAVLRSQAKTLVTFRDHDSASAGIRIEAWSELATNDLLFVGTELMKIQSLPTHPDADCIFFAAEGKRLGYFGTTPTHHANGTPMYKVTPHPPGTIFPPNGFPVFTLYYRNDDGGPGYGRDSCIVFDPPADGEYQVRITDARGFGGANFGYRLTVRRPAPSFKLRLSATASAVPNGSAVPVTITAERFDGYDGPINVHFENLPPGFSAPATTIEAGTFSTVVALFAQANAPSPPPKTPIKVIGDAMIDGKKAISETPGGVPTIGLEGEIRTWTDEAAATIKPGEQTKVRVHIERRKGFTGRVPLDVKGLPHGVRVLDIGLNGILVNENETARTIVIYAEPWVQPMERPFVVLAKREGKGTEHAAKAVMLKVR